MPGFATRRSKTSFRVWKEAAQETLLVVRTKTRSSILGLGVTARASHGCPATVAAQVCGEQHLLLAANRDKRLFTCAGQIL